MGIRCFMICKFLLVSNSMVLREMSKVLLQYLFLINGIKLLINIIIKLTQQIIISIHHPKSINVHIKSQSLPLPCLPWKILEESKLQHQMHITDMFCRDDIILVAHYVLFQYTIICCKLERGSFVRAILASFWASNQTHMNPPINLILRNYSTRVVSRKICGKTVAGLHISERIC